MYTDILFGNESFGAVLVGFTAVIGDFLVEHSDLLAYKAIFDNTTHAIIGGLTWFIVSNRIKRIGLFKQLLEIAGCAFISSVIDIDHFLVARSFQLRDATNIQGRPPLHCSTIPICMTASLLICARYVLSENIYRLAWIIFAAFASHHTRDATRRGFWFYKFGSTQAVPYNFYILATVLLPFGIGHIAKSFYVHSNRPSSRDIFTSDIL